MLVSLRPWTLNDLEWLAQNGNNPAVSRNMTDSFPNPYKADSAIAFVTAAMAEKPTCIFAIEIDGEIAGSIGLHPQADVKRKNAELGYWLAEQFWGRGIASEAVKEMLNYSFQNFDIQRVFARPFGFNLASQRVLEKAGFKLEYRLKDGFFKNNNFTDELIYSVLRDEFVFK
jgi:[ribosomal protein S5]-alanine N-acetyltransferase